MDNQILKKRVKHQNKYYNIYFIKQKKIKYFYNFLEKMFIETNTKPIVGKKQNKLLSLITKKNLFNNKLEKKIKKFLKNYTIPTSLYEIVYVFEEQNSKSKKCSSCNINFSYNEKIRIKSHQYKNGNINNYLEITNKDFSKFLDHKKWNNLILILEEFII